MSTLDSGHVIMPFGKYKGETIQYIFETDVPYLAWAIDTVDDFSLVFSDYDLTLIENRYNAMLLEEEEQSWFIDDDDFIEYYY